MEHKSDRLPIFTERFRELQGERSNTGFADFLGISRQTVGFYYNGDRVPDAITLIKISQKCGVSADWLLGISEAKSLDNDVQDICKKTGLSEGIVKYLLHNQGHPQSGGFTGFAPIKYFNALFPPEKLHGLLIQLTAYNVAEEKFTEDLKSIDADLDDNRLFETLTSAYSNLRLWRFEAIEALTRIFDDFSKIEEFEKAMNRALDGDDEE